MKKLWMYCVPLCLAALLLCGAALAADSEVGDVTTNDNAVRVEKVSVADNDVKFSITRSGAENGQLYLVMIQKGDSNAPTKSDIYYINVDSATGANFTTEAYPRDMDAGDYIIYLSDYTGDSNGARKAVASFTVTDGSEPDDNEYTLGDVNNDGNIDATDAMNVMQMFAGLDNGDTAWTDAQKKAANVNGDDSTDATDAMWIMQRFAGLMDENWRLK